MISYVSSSAARAACVLTAPATRILPIQGKRPITFIANDTIFQGFDDKVFEQAVNTAESLGVDQVIVGPDGHAGYGCPVGSVVVTDGYVYPGPVGPDACCSMSYLQTNVPDSEIADKSVRRALINAICERIPTGMGSTQLPKARKIAWEDLAKVPVCGGASNFLLPQLGIPSGWRAKLEHLHFGSSMEELEERFAGLDVRIKEKIKQLGSYGGGNHFGEAQAVIAEQDMQEIASQWGIFPGTVGFLSHCGSRGFGYQLTASHFKSLEHRFKAWGIPLSGGEKELVYAPVDSPEGKAYLLDMALASNFAIVNHLLINAYVLEAFQEVLPGAKGDLVYHIAHNIGSEEVVDGRKKWVFRKGATRALPADHWSLTGTPFAQTGHPILLPGNPEAGSRIMVGQEGASKTAYSINHGAGRAMGRNHAKRTLNQAVVDQGLAQADILHNGRQYPIDEAPAAYKDFNQVMASVEEAGLAKTVARLQARFVIKDNDKSAEGSA